MIILALVIALLVTASLDVLQPGVSDNKQSKLRAERNRIIQKAKIFIIPVIEFTSGSHTDSILKLHGMLYNGKRGIYLGRYKKCSSALDFFSGGVAHRNLELPRKFKFSWFHKLSGNTYSATMSIKKKTIEWTFYDYLPAKMRIVKTEDAPTIVVIYRTRNRVEAWLVLLGDTKEKTAIKIGEAIGVVTSHSNRKFPTYLDLKGSTKASIFQGYVHKYDREFDHTLSKKERFGCQRDQHDILMEEKFPLRHSLLVGLKGEFIPCTTWLCEDRPEKNKWQEMLFKGQLKTGSYSLSNPYPLLEHPKYSKKELDAEIKALIKRRKERYLEKKRIWICLMNDKPCFKGIAKDYGYKG